MSWTLVLLVTTATAAQAQRESRTLVRRDANVLVARGEGTAAPKTSIGRVAAPPRDLTSAEVQTLIAAAGETGLTVTTISGPWKVSPNDPVIKGRLDLSSFEVAAVYSDLFPGGVYDLNGDGEVELHFKPPMAGGKKYLIDCKVDPVSKYRVRVYPGDETQVFENTHHLAVLYPALSGDTATVKITAEPPHRWIFYSCEVTGLD